MKSGPWTDDETETLKRMHASGDTANDMAESLGRTYESVRGRLRFCGLPINRGKRGPRPKPVEIEPEERLAMSEASANARIAELERKLLAVTTGLNPSRLPVETKAEPPTSPEEVWARAEEESDRRINHAIERSRFSIDFDSFDAGKPVAVCFVSDQHISPGNTVDHRRMREDAELIAATPGLYACLGGDGVDNHIAIRSAGLAARSQPSDQWQLYEWYLSIFAPKILALISGNHDAWTDQIAGIDMVSEIARRQKLCYCPSEAHIKAHVGGVNYRITFRHQYRFNSSMNQGHAPKQLWRFGEEDFDIGCVCHHHEAHAEYFDAHCLTRWVCRPGSYQITSSYTRQHGWNRTRPTCPTAILFPGSRRIIGFRDVRDAVLTLAAERAK